MKLLSELFHAYFEETAKRGVEEKFFRIAGRTVLMRFAADRWIGTFTKALEHLRVPSGAPDFTLHIWDGEVQARNHLLRAYLFTLTNWWFEYTGPRGQLLDIYSRETAALYDPLSGLLSLLDYGSGNGFLWKRDLSEMPYFETCAPARVLLHAWFKSQSIQMVHGAAVGTESGGVLLAGPGGSGKSSSALACLDSGLGYLSDDYCMVSREGSGFRVHSLYGAAKLVDESDLRRFPRLGGSVWNVQRTSGEKLAFFINEERPETLIDEFPLRAILVPVITGARETALEQCPPGEALAALAPSTMAQMPASDGSDLSFMAEMVRRVPCYHLRAGTDISQIPAGVAELLAPTATTCASS